MRSQNGTTKTTTTTTPTTKQQQNIPQPIPFFVIIYIRHVKLISDCGPHIELKQPKKFKRAAVLKSYIIMIGS
jgi:hypothetical protein